MLTRADMHTKKVVSCLLISVWHCLLHNQVVFLSKAYCELVVNSGVWWAHINPATCYDLRFYKPAFDQF